MSQTMLAVSLASALVAVTLGHINYNVISPIAPIAPMVGQTTVTRTTHGGYGGMPMGVGMTGMGMSHYGSMGHGMGLGGFGTFGGVGMMRPHSMTQMSPFGDKMIKTYSDGHSHVRYRDGHEHHIPSPMGMLG